MAADGIAKLIYQPKYILKEYFFESTAKHIDLKCSLDNRKLTVKGKSQGREITKKYNISSKWIQDFNFGFHEFLEAQNREMTFLMLNPNDFTINEMIVKKQNIEKIKIGHINYNAQKVEVTLPGFKSMFWKAQIWYDLESYDLIKYIADKGPGTPVTTILLESKK